MAANRKTTGRASTIPSGLAAGAGLSLVLTITISAISAHLISIEFLPEARIGYCAIMILLLASCLGAWLAARKVKRMPVQIAVLNGAVYFGVLLSITALFFGGQYQGMGVTLTVVLLGSGAGGIMAMKKPKRKIQKRHKKTYR